MHKGSILMTSSPPRGPSPEHHHTVGLGFHRMDLRGTNFQSFRQSMATAQGAIL